MQTSDIKAYPKVGPFTGSLGVDALAVWVPLIYFSQTAITFTKKVKVLWVTATTNFHFKSLAKYPTTSYSGYKWRCYRGGTGRTDRQQGKR